MGENVYEDLAVKLQDISKSFGANRVLDNIELSVPHGICLGIKGKNGAGKSILLRTIAGLIKADSGSVYVLGCKLGSDRDFAPQTGVLFEPLGFLFGMSGMDNLKLLASIRGEIRPSEIADVLVKVGLDPNDKRPVKTYSTGMRQKLGLAQALMESPRLLLLDEPTSALDEKSVTQFWENIREFRQNGGSVVCTSHNAEDLDQYCDAVMKLESGRLHALKQ